MTRISGTLEWPRLALVMFVWAIAAGAHADSDAAYGLHEERRKLTELNVSIVVFDAGIPTDVSSHRRLQVFPRIREVEAMFLPFVLRDTLVNTEQWGAVRVVPEPDLAAELLITGRIIRSDGMRLELQMRAVDATGRVWLEQTYAADAVEAGADLNQSDKGFGALYRNIEQDLRAVRSALDDASLAAIVEVSLLRYADQLAPAAFAQYLGAGDNGTFEILRLPAENDPMLERIERIRRVEYLVTDTVDEKYQQLNDEIASTYDLWRKYRRQLAQYRHREQQRQQASESKAARSSFESMKSRYDNYRWSRLEEQDIEGWAQGFDNEVAPTVMELEARVDELQGLIEAQYAEWGRILAELFALETGTGD